ncbi:hypothetical protein HZ326_9212 [Fusarium oxysporum f. sp. albedinis]|nr:hypothetical protein HZ326_9212 [Fusarium oxysporum f. sp. albedinis]KAK2483687.1 hypothetical protein H9L39_05479 [Fusarium oxysporum f. sp. albedinis]
MANWSEAFRQCVFILLNSLDDLLATNLAPSALETPPIASTMILRLLLNSSTAPWPYSHPDAKPRDSSTPRYISSNH